MRRSFQRVQPLLEFRGVSLDPVSQEVRYQQRLVNLPRKKFLLLQQLSITPLSAEVRPAMPKACAQGILMKARWLSSY
jgi:two-component system response regulator QseB